MTVSAVWPPPCAPARDRGPARSLTGALASVLVTFLLLVTVLLVTGLLVTVPAATAAGPQRTETAPGTIAVPISGSGQVPESTVVPVGAQVEFRNETDGAVLVSADAVEGTGRAFDAGRIGSGGAVTVALSRSTAYSVYAVPPVGEEPVRFAGGVLILDLAPPAGAPAAAGPAPEVGGVSPGAEPEPSSEALPLGEDLPGGPLPGAEPGLSAGGHLVQPTSPRRYGLPVTLALLLVLGVGSMVGRAYRAAGAGRPGQGRSVNGPGGRAVVGSVDGSVVGSVVGRT